MGVVESIPARNATPESLEQREEDSGKRKLPPERVTAESIGFLAASLSTGWAAFSEFVPLLPKVLAGTLLGVVGAVSAGKSWLNKREERERGVDEGG